MSHVRRGNNGKSLVPIAKETLVGINFCHHLFAYRILITVTVAESAAAAKANGATPSGKPRPMTSLAVLRTRNEAETLNRGPGMGYCEG